MLDARVEQALKKVIESEEPVVHEAAGVWGDMCVLVQEFVLQNTTFGDSINPDWLCQNGFSMILWEPLSFERVVQIEGVRRSVVVRWIGEEWLCEYLVGTVVAPIPNPGTCARLRLIVSALEGGLKHEDRAGSK